MALLVSHEVKWWYIHSSSCPTTATAQIENQSGIATTIATKQIENVVVNSQQTVPFPLCPALGRSMHNSSNNPSSFVRTYPCY